MKRPIAYIAGTGRGVPDKILKNADFAALGLETGDEWITSRTGLDAELDAVSARGWAMDDAEFEDFVNCVAVPIRTTAGVVGALSLTAIRMVQDLEELALRVPLLQRTAGRIAREVG